MLDLKSIEKAYDRVSTVAHRTPLSFAPILSQLSGYEVYLEKREFTAYRCI